MPTQCHAEAAAAWKMSIWFISTQLAVKHVFVCRHTLLIFGLNPIASISFYGSQTLQPTDIGLGDDAASGVFVFQF